MATETLSEAEKMRRVPGIYFATEPLGRVAKVEGTGIEVWLIASAYRRGGRSVVDAAYHFLTPEQRQAALDYYALFSEEIDARLDYEDQITPEWLYERYPFMRPAAANPPCTEPSPPDAPDRSER